MKCIVLGLTLCWALTCQATSLRVVFEVSPPHQTWVDGKAGGLATELVQQLLRQAGVSAQFEAYPWARAYKLAESTPNMLIFNIARTPERESKFIWIGPVAQYHFGFVHLRSRQDINIQQFSDAKRYIIGVQRGDFAAEFLTQQGVATEQLQKVADIEQSWRLLLAGKVDLLIDDPLVAQPMLRRFQLRDDDVTFRFVLPELQQTTWIAVHPQTDPTLIKALQQAYQKVLQSPAYRRTMDYKGLNPSLAEQ